MRTGRGRDVRGSGGAPRLAVALERCVPDFLQQAAQIVERAVVLDYQRRVLRALFVGQLCADSRVRLVRLQSPLDFDSRDHLFPRRAHQPDFVEQRLPVRLDQNCSLDNYRQLRAARAQFGDFAANTLARRRPYDRRKLVQLFRLSKNDRAELPAIDCTIGRDNILTERSDHRVVCGSTGRVGGVRDFVRVENLCAKLAENLRDRAFARTDSACEADSKHSKSLARRFAGPRLDVVEVAEETAESQQLIERSLLDDRAVAQHQNSISVLNRREPMRDHQRGPFAHRLAHCGQHHRFGLGVERAGRLVHDQNRRILQQRARDRHALRLAFGKTVTALPHHFVEAGRQLGEHRPEASHLDRAHHLCVVDLGLPERDVDAHRVAEHQRRLQHHRDIAAQRIER